MKQLVIDRFEEQIAICEYEEGKKISLPKEVLPEQAEEGSVLSIRVNKSETRKRRKYAEQLKKKLLGT